MPKTIKSVFTKEYQELLRKLQRARIRAGLSQIEVAKKIKKPQSFVSKCESGERRVDFIELRRFAKLYRKPLSYFEPSH